MLYNNDNDTKINNNNTNDDDDDDDDSYSTPWLPLKSISFTSEWRETIWGKVS